MELTTVGDGRFQIRGLAGEGGMSLVYRGLDRDTGLPVAIKVLREGVGVADRFERESVLLAEIDDPGIVRYVAHGTTDAGQHFLVTEWLEGTPLSNLLEAGGLSIDDTLRLGRRAAAGLGRLHERGIVHRDVKPSNLFLRGGTLDRVALIDLGIARAHHRDADLTGTGIAIGTPGFLSPEQARGERDIDARADVFALGCVLFRCATGRAPFRGDDALAVQLKIILDETPRVRRYRPEAPEELDLLVARMLSKSRADRPADGAAVALELARVRSAPMGAGGTARQPAGLTDAEQRLMSVVLVRGRDEAPTLPGAELARRGAALEGLAELYQARFDAIGEANGVFTIAGAGAAVDQAVRAARCALAARDLRGDARVAVATGEGVVTGTFPLGPIIDRAVRLVDLSGAEVRVDDLTAGLLPPQFELRRDDGGVLLLGERDHSEPIRTLLGRPTPFVGRRKELRILEAVLDECLGDGVARGVLLVGPAGIGKSRVRYEFMRALTAAGRSAQVWLGRGDPLLATSPFGLLAQALRRACGIRHSAAIDERRAALRARVARHLPAAEVDDTVTFLGEMIGTQLSDEDLPQLRAARENARIMNDRIADRWEALLRAECAARPVVLVLEDLHWADLSSVRLVDDALRVLGDLPLMILAIARPDIDTAFPSLWEGRDVHRVQLLPLTRAASAELVRGALGPAATEQVVDRVCDRAAGNAFFLEELIRVEAEGAAAGTNDAPPSTVVAVVHARLEALEPEARRVLRAGSVLGRVFWRGAIDALLGADDSLDVDRWLSDLTAREVLSRQSETRIAHEVQYAFRHVLVREAAYAALTAEDRARGHRLAAGWLERVGEADKAVLAEHFEKGGAPERAGPCWHAAAERALSGGDPDAALAFAARAVQLGAEGEALGAVELLQAAAHDWKGEYEESEPFATRALARLPRGGRAWCRAAGLLGRVLLNRGRIDALRGVALDLLEVARRGPPTAEVAVASLIVVYALRMAGARDEAEALIECVESTSAPKVLADPNVRAYLALCRAVLDQSNIALDLRLRREAAACFAEAGDTLRSRVEMYNCYLDLVELGAYDEAQAELGVTHSWAVRRNLMSIVWVSRSLQAEALWRLGRPHEAVPVMREVAVALARTQSGRKHGGTLVALARALVSLGELDEAEQVARQAVSVLEVNGRPLLPTARTALALVALARGRADEALGHTRTAVAEAAESGGLESGESMLYLVHAEALWAAGAQAEARDAIGAARARVQAVAAAIDEPALRASYLGRIEENARTLELAARWLDAPAT